MTCTECGHNNGADARFCNECGAPLALRCPSCASPQPAGAKFCNQCGAPLAAPAVTGSPAPAAVRKWVTAVFVDLVGSTAFGERLDPEAVRAAITPYFELVRTTIEDHAGTVVKYMGDGAMAIFGLPEVAEDDAIRAVTAGVELQRRFRGFAEQIGDRYGVELGLRVGINSGELVVADDDADLVGDVLNTAARLESACQPGSVLVGEDTWRLTRSVIEYEILGDVHVKGKADPIATFRVIDEDRTIVDDIPFVGRETELGQLLLAFGDARDSPIARLVTVIGPPGVGKTRLATQLRSTVDAHSYDLRFERRGSTTFTPIVQLLRDVTDGSVDAVERLFADRPDAGRLVPILQSFLGHGDARSTEESFWAVRRLLEHLAADEPVIVVVDDIQWAEPLFWDLLDHLVEWAEAPVLIVALARPELRELRPELAQAGRRVAAAISLEGLDETATQELAAHLLGTDRLPTELLERIPRSTEGNPLFIRELVQMLVDDGTLARDGDRWHLTIDAGAIEVPPTILSLLASRVERLPDDEREVVELASVIGTEFDRGTLATIAPPPVAGRMSALLDRLRRKDLVEPSGAWAGDHPVYRFHHVLVRDAAYRRLLKGRRADLHEAVGRHTESTGARGSELDVVVAHHYEQVVRYRRELDTVDLPTRELASQAVERLRRAADEALSREDLPAAGGYARRALELVGDSDPARDELLVLGCEALLSSGDVGSATPLVRELHERSSDPRLAAWADCFRAQRWSLTDADRLAEAAELADDAAGRLDALDDQSGVAKARLVRATCLTRLGRVGEGEAELDLALGAARSAGDRRRTVAVLGAAPLAALWGPSPVARAGGRCLDVLRLLRITTASPAVEATSIRCQGMLEALRGRFDSAREKFASSWATAHELGLRHGLYETELFAGFVDLWAGDPEAAEAHLRTAHEGFGRLGIGAEAGQAAAYLASALLRHDRVDEAEALAREAVAAAGQNLKTAMVSRAALAEVLAARDDPDEACAVVTEAVAIAEQTDLILDRALVLQAAARVHATAGDAASERSHSEQSRTMLGVKGISTDEPVRVDDRSAQRADAAISQGSAGSEPAHSGSARLSNAAWTTFQALGEAFAVGDRDRALALTTDDITVLYADDDASGPLDRESYVQIAIDGFGWHTSRVATCLAVRGDDLCLVRFERARGDVATVNYFVLGVSDGRQDLQAWFGADGLTDAVDALDDEWARRGAPQVADWSRRISHAVASGDRERVRACLDDEFVAIDHRALGFGRRDADEFADSTVASADQDVVLYQPQLFAYADRTLLSSVRRVSGDDSSEWIAVLEFGSDGTVARLETFAPADADRAHRRFAELAGDPLEPANMAARFRGLTAAFATGDRAVIDTFFAPDFRIERRMPARKAMGTPPQSRDEDIDAALAEFAAPISLQLGTRRVVAVRGDHLYLAHQTLSNEAGDEIESFLLVEAEPPQICRIVQFGADQFVDALDELELSWERRGDAPAFATLFRRFQRAASEGDRTAVRAMLRDDFVAVDHRPIGFGRRGRDEFVESAVFESGDEGLVFVSQYLETTDHIRLAVVDRVTGDNVSRFLCVARFANDRLARFDNFLPDDLDDAYHLFSDLTADAREENHVPEASLALENAATRLTDRWNEAALDGDLEGMRSLRSDDVVYDNRREWHSAMGVGRRIGDEADEAALAAVGQGMTAIGRTTIAIRGERLAVSRVVNTYETGAESVSYLLSESTGDRLTRRTRFDDLRDALDELDRRWAETGEAAPTIEADRKMFGLLMRGDRDGVRELLADDFVARDHRPLGFGSRTADQWVRSGVPEPDGGTFVFAAAYLEATDRTTLLVVARTDGVNDGSFLSLAELSDGSYRRIETFAIDDLESARTRFREVTDGSWGCASPPLDNTASRLANRFTAAALEHDRDTMVALLADGAVYDNRRSWHSAMRVGPRRGDEIVDSTLGLVEQGLSAIDRDVLAIRGDELAVARTVYRFDTGERSDHLVIECDGGRVTRFTRFDDLHEALDELDRRWGEREGTALANDHATLMVAFRHALRDGDVATVDARLDDEFFAIDHRPVGMGRRSREQWLASTGAPFESAGGIDWISTDVSFDGDVMFQPVTLTARSGEPWKWEFIVISGVRDGRFTFSETFPPEMADAALARFRELARRSALVPLQHPLERLTGRFVEHFPGETFDDVRDELFEPDFVREDRRRGTTFPTAGLDEYRAAAALGDTPSFGPGPILAVRPNAYLGETSTRYADGAVDDSMILVVGGPTGRLSRFVVFHHDDLRAAFDELDRVADVDPTVRQLLAHSQRVRTAFVEQSPALLRDTLTPDAVFVDHRPLGFGPLTIDDFIQSLEPLVTGDAVLVSFEADVLAADGDVCLSRHVGIDPLTRSEWSSLSLRRLDGDRVEYMELFAIDDVAAARARWSELLAESPSNDVDRIENAATQLLRPITEAMNARPFDRERWRALVHPEYLVEPRSPQTGVEGVLDRDGMAEQLAAIAERDGQTEVEPIAIRGADLFAFHLRVIIGGDVSERHGVVEVVDGRLRRQIDFGRDQRDETFEELDRMWVERGGRIDPLVNRLRRAMTDGLYDAHADLFAPEFECVDRRELGFGTRDRDEYLASTAALVGNVTVDGVAEYPAPAQDGISLWRSGMRSDTDGSRWEFIILQEHDGERITRWEQFPVTARARAIARFDERRALRAARVAHSDHADRAMTAFDRLVPPP